MRIAFDALNIRKGGGETVMVRLADAFAAAGHEMLIVSGERSLIDRLTPALRDRVTVRHVPMAASAVGALRYRYGGWQRDVAARCDVVFGFNYWTPGKPFQVTYHINVIPFLSWRDRIAAVGVVRAVMNRVFAVAALRRSDLNLFESRHLHALADASVSAPIRHADVRYIGVEGPAGALAPVASADEAQGPYLCAVTSPARHKRNEHLFALHDTINRDRPDGERIGLTIVGLTRDECADQPALAPHRAAIANDPAIRFLGYVDRATLYATLAEATALVSFSELESFYMVAVEAMSVGCPTVTADISSVSESVGDAGLLFTPGDVDDAAAKVRLLLDPAVRARWAERAFGWAARFDGRTCAARIVAAVEAAHAGRGR